MYSTKKKNTLTKVFSFFLVLCAVVALIIGTSSFIQNAKAAIGDLPSAPTWLSLEKANCTTSSDWDTTNYTNLIKANKEFALNLSNLEYIEYEGVSSEPIKVKDLIEKNNFQKLGDEWEIEYLPASKHQIDGIGNLLCISIKRPNDNSTTTKWTGAISLYYTNVYDKINGKYVNAKVTINSVNLGNIKEYCGSKNDEGATYSDYLSILRVYETTGGAGSKTDGETDTYTYNGKFNEDAGEENYKYMPGIYGGVCETEINVTTATYGTEEDIASEEDFTSTNWDDDNKLYLRQIYHITDIDSLTDTIDGDRREGIDINSSSNIEKCIVYNGNQLDMFVNDDTFYAYTMDKTYRDSDSY